MRQKFINSDIFEMVQAQLFYIYIYLYIFIILWKIKFHVMYTAHYYFRIKQRRRGLQAGAISCRQAAWGRNKLST